MKRKWTEIQSILEKTIGQVQVKVWIAPLLPQVSGTELVLRAPSDFAAAHVRHWFLDRVAEAVRLVCGEGYAVRVEAGQGRQASAPAARKDVSQSGPVLDLPASPVANKAPAALLVPAAKDKPAPRPLSSVSQCLLPELAARADQSAPDQIWRFSFDDFVVGPCNELAYAASRSMCSESRQSDVLLLCSPPGLGKTHLMQAVGHTLYSSSNRARPRVGYLTAEEFTSRFYLALKAHDIDRFKARYRELDLLMLEDVHFLQGKEKTQAELLATIKAVRDRGGKVVFSSSFSPREMKDMDEHLTSRLCAGLFSFIERPDEETRRRIVRHKASMHQVLLPEDVENMLVRHIKADVRQIESCLHTLILKAKLLNTRITPQMAWEVLAQYAQTSPVLDMEAIMQAVCAGFGLSREQLVSAARKQTLVRARNTAFYLARKHTDLSLEHIGRHFNRRHSTVLKGITSLEREIRLNTPLGRQIEGTMAMIERNGNIVSPLS